MLSVRCLLNDLFVATPVVSNAQSNQPASQPKPIGSKPTSTQSQDVQGNALLVADTNPW